MKFNFQSIYIILSTFYQPLATEINNNNMPCLFPLSMSTLEFIENVEIISKLFSE